MLKMPLFLSTYGQFSVHKFEKSKFIARTWIEYFHMSIFVILVIKKYVCQTQALFSVFQCFLGHRAGICCKNVTAIISLANTSITIMYIEFLVTNLQKVFRKVLKSLICLPVKVLTSHAT